VTRRYSQVGRPAVGALALGAAVALAALVLMCNGHEEEDDDAPILGPDHMGWRSQHCASCHELPEEDHTTSDEHACAECHGGNGACDPNGSAGVREHGSSDDCRTCHDDNHGFDVADSCASCHFAFAGVISCAAPTDGDGDTDVDGDTDSDVDGDTDSDADVDADADADADADGDAGPDLSDAVVEGCFDWPGTEWSPSNRAGVTAGLREGTRAVELDLLDTSGAAHTLSGLLASRPVLLVFGAYT